MECLYICKECYDDKIIECNKCKIPCKLLYGGNNYVWNNDECRDNEEMYEMHLCEKNDCDIFVCTNCIEKDDSLPQQDGHSKRCKEKDCVVLIATCKNHLNDILYCCLHKNKNTES